MNWSSLLNWDRLQETRTGEFFPGRSPYEVDYDRIVFSSHFRRLQDKTQVLPLSGSDYVRTRLTHSVEVAAVARTLGTTAGITILKKYSEEEILNGGRTATLAQVFKPVDIGMIVSAAASAHDLGNPPFGHSGEEAVRHWFTHSALLKEVREKVLTPEEVADFTNWEGNAQGFRILARLQMYKNQGGMRLSYATLAAFCKYPTYATAIDQSKEPVPSRKKFGVFSSERSLFEEVFSKVGIAPDPTGLKAWNRHPLAFLMEAADDICYRIVDLEDGVRLRLIPFDQAYEILKPFANQSNLSRLAGMTDPTDKISYFRAFAIRSLVDQVARLFGEKEEDMRAGRWISPLAEHIPDTAILHKIKQVMDLVYKSAGVLEVEAAGFQIIPGLLDLYWSAISDDTKFNRRAAKVLDLLPEPIRLLAAEKKSTAYDKLLAITDHVSGMTDSYALSTYRKLNGISLPS